MTLPRVHIVSPFRDNVNDVFAFIRQVNSLEYPSNLLRFITIEGDSTDGTLEELLNWQSNDGRVVISKCDVGVPKFKSVVSKARFEVLAKVFNTGLDEAVQQSWADYVLFAPSDVIFEPDLLTRLLAAQKDIIAPMFWTAKPDINGGRFYDIWGFRRNGEPFPPYGYAWYEAHLPDEPVRMDTVGGVVLIKMAILRSGCRYTPEHVDHGLCQAAQDRGYSVWCDPTTHVLHR